MHTRFEIAQTLESTLYPFNTSTVLKEYTFLLASHAIFGPHSSNCAR
jgi:hypothetical protein